MRQRYWDGKQFPTIHAKYPFVRRDVGIAQENSCSILHTNQKQMNTDLGWKLLDEIQATGKGQVK